MLRRWPRPRRSPRVALGLDDAIAAAAGAAVDGCRLSYSAADAELRIEGPPGCAGHLAPAAHPLYSTGAWLWALTGLPSIPAHPTADAALRELQAAGLARLADGEWFPTTEGRRRWRVALLAAPMLAAASQPGGAA